MLKLSPELHDKFSSQVITLLQDKGYSTVADFLRADSNTLRQITNIDLVSLGHLKSDLWKSVKLVPINGLEHYQLLMKQAEYLSTGIKSLDQLLNGGLLSGNIYDVCGTSASGKTQLHTTIAINWAINYGFETLVVDAKGDFSGDRINRILLSRGAEYDAEKRKNIMRHIRYEKCYSPFKLIEILNNLLEQIHLYPKVKFFVIDSMPALWFLFHGNQRSFGNRKLSILADLLRKLAVEHAIVVLTVNIETRSIVTNGDENVVDELDRNDSNLMNRTTPPVVSETTVPALGKHWKSICSFRLQIKKQIDTSRLSTVTNQFTNERTIRILKSNQNRTDIQCQVHLTDAGVI